MSTFRPVLALVACLAVAAPAAAQQAPEPALSTIIPAFSVWDVKIGEPAASIPAREVVAISCGTNGGPPSLALKDFSEFAKCPAEPSGLHEVYWQNDDEDDYIAKALEDEYKVLQGGTSIYAHPVVISALIDDTGIVRGIRIVTDDRASDHERRIAVTLARNLRERFGSWNLDCQSLPLEDGQQAVGTQFEHNLCTGQNPDGTQVLRLESIYLRKKGQGALNLETQQVNRGYYESSTRLEIVQKPFTPADPPSL